MKRKLFPYPKGCNWLLLQTELKDIPTVVDANDVAGQLAVYKKDTTSFSSELTGEIEAALKAHDGSVQTLDQAVEKDLITSMPLFEQLMEMTPTEAGEWVDEFVKDIDTAKTALKKMAMLLVYILHK